MTDRRCAECEAIRGNPRITRSELVQGQRGPMESRRNNRRQCAGKADPFGLLVLAVVLAVSLTIAVQAQVSASEANAAWSPAEAPLFKLD